MSIEFPITPKGRISNSFRKLGIGTFTGAAHFIKHLPYGRNPNKADPATIFTDGRGTCSSKHALLKLLADENGVHDLELVIGIFRMNGRNTPAVKNTLERHRLDHIPEAHCYLKHGELIIDCTRAGSSPSDFADDLITELPIAPDQITQFKVELQRSFIAQWIEDMGPTDHTLEKVWDIREQCIQDLADLDQRHHPLADR